MNLNSQENGEAGDDANNCLTYFNLTGLPSLILERILIFLDKSALRNLRAVCWATKNMVEEPKHLRRLQIRITNATRLGEIQNSTVQWNNICLQEMTWTPTNQPQQIYLPLLQSSLQFLTRLKIKARIISGQHILTILLNIGPQLQNLVCIGTLVANDNNCRIFRTGENIQESLKAEIDELKFELEKYEDTLQKNLIGLLHAELRNIFRNPGTSFRLLVMFLNCCPNLTTLNVPVIDSSEIIRNQIAQLTCAPILDYLRRKLRLDKRQPLLRIDLCHRPWNSLMTNSKQIECLFPLTPSILIEMATLCQKTRVKLYNVPSSALPPSSVLTQIEKESINETVASVLCANVMTGITDNYIPPGCPVKILMATTITNTDQDLPNFQLPNDSINIVSIVCGCQYSKTLVRIMFQRVLPTVTELQIMNTDNENIWSVQNGVHGRLASVFPNLKKLSLGSIEIKPGFDFLNGLEDSLEMLYLGSVTGCLDLPAISHWMSKMNKLKYFGLGSNCLSVSDSCVTLRTPGHFGKLKWHEDE